MVEFLEESFPESLEPSSEESSLDSTSDTNFTLRPQELLIPSEDPDFLASPPSVDAQTRIFKPSIRSVSIIPESVTTGCALHLNRIHRDGSISVFKKGLCVTPIRVGHPIQFGFYGVNEPTIKAQSRLRVFRIFEDTLRDKIEYRIELGNGQFYKISPQPLSTLAQNQVATFFSSIESSHSSEPYLYVPSSILATSFLSRIPQSIPPVEVASADFFKDGFLIFVYCKVLADPSQAASKNPVYQVKPYPNLDATHSTLYRGDRLRIESPLSRFVLLTAPIQDFTCFDSDFFPFHSIRLLDTQGDEYFLVRTTTDPNADRGARV